MIQPLDAFLSTSAPGLHLLEARCTIFPDEVPQRDVETPYHNGMGKDSDGLEELGAEDDSQDNNDEADEIAPEARKFRMQKRML